MALEVAKRTTARQRNLRAAFSLLDIRHQEWIDGATMISLFLAIGRYRCVTLFTLQAEIWFWTIHEDPDVHDEHIEHVCGRAFSILCNFEKELICYVCRHIPDVRARTSHLFLALNRRGDFKIWSDEFEDLCDVIAKEVESPPDLKQLRRRSSRSEMQFVTHPVYSYVTWAFTLGSLAVAITQFNVSPLPGRAVT